MEAADGKAIMLWPISPFFKRYVDQAETGSREMLWEKAFESAFAEGQKLSLDDALYLVLEIVTDENILTNR